MRLKIYFYDCPPEIESINNSPALIAYTLYYRNIVRLLKKYEVKEPEDADFFFIPVNLIKFQFHKTFINPVKFIHNLDYLGQKPHLLFAIGDFGQRKKSIYENHQLNRPYPYIYPWLDEKFILLAFESTKDLLPQDIALFPYLLKDERPFAPRSRWTKMPLERDLLFSFVGQTTYQQLPEEHIRGGKLLYFKKKRKNHFVGTPEESIRRFGKVKGHHIRMFERSKFVLCPAGFGRWTFRLGEAIAYGCIPIIIADGYILPLSSYIPWEQFTFRIPENELFEINGKLKSITPANLSLLQKNLSEYASLLNEESIHQFLISELCKRKESLTNKSKLSPPSFFLKDEPALL